MLDRQRRLVRWNKERERITGYSADELRAMRTGDHAAPEDRESVAASVERGFREGRTRREHWMLTEGFVGQSKVVRHVLGQVEQVAGTRSTVLVLGETGVGKGLIARAIHRLSPRPGRPLVKVNCASLPCGLVESELFGREKGAYTGPSPGRTGDSRWPTSRRSFWTSVAPTVVVPRGSGHHILGVVFTQHMMCIISGARRYAEP